MDCEELYISYFFPPSNQASGIVTFKRIIENGRKVDVLQGDFKKSDEEGFRFPWMESLTGLISYSSLWIRD